MPAEEHGVRPRARRRAAASPAWSAACGSQRAAGRRPRRRARGAAGAKRSASSAAVERVAVVEHGDAARRRGRAASARQRHRLVVVGREHAREVRGGRSGTASAARPAVRRAPGGSGRRRSERGDLASGQPRAAELRQGGRRQRGVERAERRHERGVRGVGARVGAHCAPVEQPGARDRVVARLDARAAARPPGTRARARTNAAACAICCADRRTPPWSGRSETISRSGRPAAAVERRLRNAAWAGAPARGWAAGRARSPATATHTPSSPAATRARRAAEADRAGDATRARGRGARARRAAG